MFGVKYIDFDIGLSRVRNNKKLYLKLLKMFADSDEFQKLDKAISTGDSKAAAQAVHAIKGMSGNLALDSLFDITSQLMIQYRQNNVNVNPELLKLYQTVLNNTLQEIQALLSEQALKS